jgi:hypothetical protein
MRRTGNASFIALNSVGYHIFRQRVHSISSTRIIDFTENLFDAAGGLSNSTGGSVIAQPPPDPVWRFPSHL